MADQLRHRPCGACGELVPADSGCRHWKPGSPAGKRNGWPRRFPKMPTGYLSTQITAATEHKIRAIECSCGKPPGPPLPHAYDCAKVVAARELELDRQARDTVE